MKVAEELIAVLSLSIDRNKWNEAEKRLKSINKKFFGLKTRLLGTASAFVFVESKLGKMMQGISNTSTLLQIPVKQLQAIKLAAAQTAVPLNNVMTTLNKFQSGFVNMRAGYGLPSGWAQGFTKLSQLSGQQINPFNAKSGYQLFSQIAGDINKIPGVQGQEMVANQFGMTELLPLIRGGHIQKAYSQLSKGGYLYGNKTVNEGKQFNAELQTTIAKLKYIGVQIGVSLLPPLEALNKAIDNLSNNKNFITGLKNGILLLSEYAKLIAGVITETVKFLGLAAKGVRETTSYLTKEYRSHFSKGSHESIMGSIQNGMHDLAKKLGISKSHTVNNTHINTYGMSISTIHQTGNIR